MESAIKAKDIKIYKKTHQKLLYNLVLYSLTSLITFVFISHPFWFPFMKESLLNSISIFFNAKCVFILANIIVLFLIGESMITGSPRSSLDAEVYDEYVARSQRAYNLKVSTNISPAKVKEDGILQEIDVKKVENRSKNERNILKSKTSEIVLKEKGVEKKVKNELRTSKSMVSFKVSPRKKELERIQKRELRNNRSAVWDENEILKSTRSNKENEVETLDLLELNSRVDAFIARINKKRLLEAESLDEEFCTKIA